MVEKLKLPTNEHPDPYKMQWLNKDNEVKVSQHFIVSFYITKKNKEKLLCDVIPMDTCYFHLRRHWQYDRHTLYNGYANIYSFMKDGIKIKLTRLPLNEGKDEFKPLGFLVARELFKDKIKLYMPRPIAKPPWEVISMDFSLRLRWTQKQKDSINDSYQKVKICVLRTKNKILTRGRVSSNPWRMIENNEK